MDNGLLQYALLLKCEAYELYADEFEQGTQAYSQTQRQLVQYLYKEMYNASDDRLAYNKGAIKECISIALGCSTRYIQKVLYEEPTRKHSFHYSNPLTWTSHLFDKGTTHIVRGLSWYTEHIDVLKKLGQISIEENKINWIKERYADKTKYFNNRVTITYNDNNKLRISQDGGLNIWTKAELLGTE